MHFHDTLRNKSAAGGAVSAGEGPGRGSATVPEGQSSPMVVLRHAARNRDRGAPSSVRYRVKARGCSGAGVLPALCSWKIHVYRTSCPGAKQCSAPAGRTPAEGSSPSISLPERVSQRGFVMGSVFVARLLFWKQRCSCVPWPFCPSAKGPTVKEDCPDHPPQAGFPQACPPVISHCQYKPEMTNNFQRVKKGTFLAARTAVAGDHHPVKNSN